MSIVAEIEKLKGKHFLVGLIGFLGTIGPGFLIIFHYRPELVEKYDIGKLILFASSLTLPFLMACTLMYAAIEDAETETPSHAAGLKFGALFSAFILNSIFAFAYFANLSFRKMIFYVICATGGILMVAFYNNAKKLAAKKQIHLKSSIPPIAMPPPDSTKPT